MKISILTPDVSHNGLVRAWVLAQVLQRRYEVEIVGVAFDGTIWAPLAGEKGMIDKYLPSSPLFYKYFSQAKWIMSTISGDVIYASKPLLTSFGVGLILKLFKKKPLVLDIDDWQVGFHKDLFSRAPLSKVIKRYLSSALYAGDTNSYWNALLCESLISFADDITVSNSQLRSKYSGAVVQHGRDTNVIDPSLYNGEKQRRALGIVQGEKVLIFVGTPRAHKGIEDLIEAVHRLKNDKIILIIVGFSDDAYCQRLKSTILERLGIDRVRLLGLQPIKKVPELLAASDVVVIPQRRTFSSSSQVPAKVFDAMAMAKPIIATNVSDLPEILNGCGWIVEPGQPEELAQAIQYVLDNPEEAANNGLLARERCKEKYSYDAMEKVLVGIFQRFEK